VLRSFLWKDSFGKNLLRHHPNHVPGQQSKASQEQTHTKSIPGIRSDTFSGQVRITCDRKHSWSQNPLSSSVSLETPYGLTQDQRGFDKMKLSICEIETFQFVKSTNWHSQVSKICPDETFNLREWNFSIFQIDKLTVSSFNDQTNWKFQFVKLQLLVCQIHKPTLSSCNDLTKWNFQFVKFKPFNLSNRQIDVFKLQRFDKMQDSWYKIETLEFVTLSNWHIQVSAIWLNQTFNLWHFHVSNRPIETRRFPRIDTLKLSICQFETMEFVNSTNRSFPDSRKKPCFLI